MVRVMGLCAFWVVCLILMSSSTHARRLGGHSRDKGGNDKHDSGASKSTAVAPKAAAAAPKAAVASSNSAAAAPSKGSKQILTGMTFFNEKDPGIRPPMVVGDEAPSFYAIPQPAAYPVKNPVLRASQNIATAVEGPVSSTQLMDSMASFRQLPPDQYQRPIPASQSNPIAQAYQAYQAYYP